MAGNVHAVAAKDHYRGRAVTLTRTSNFTF
jgi:hypothetical protein